MIDTTLVILKNGQLKNRLVYALRLFFTNTTMVDRLHCFIRVLEILKTRYVLEQEHVFLQKLKDDALKHYGATKHLSFDIDNIWNMTNMTLLQDILDTIVV